MTNSHGSADIIGEGLPNMLEFFKLEHARPNKIRTDKTENRIFVQTTCSDDTHSYTTDRINKLFEDNDYNPENLLERMIIMMASLQEWYNTQDYSTVPYKNAPKEYPKLYEALLKNLSKEALEAIKKIDVREFSASLDRDMARKFVTQLWEDRKKLKAGPEVENASAKTSLGKDSSNQVG
jgi:hypothetical protein